MSGIYVGVDCGKDGYSAEIDAGTGAFLRADQQPLIGDGKGDTFDVSSMGRRARRWKEEGVRLVVIEELYPLGGMNKGGIAFFNQGLGFGLWKGVLGGLEIPFRTIKKAHLKKSLSIQTPKRTAREDPLPQKATKAEKAAWNKRDRQRLARWQKAVKSEAIKVTQELFPGVDLRRTERCQGPHDGKAEALLYAVLASKLDPARSGVV